MVEVINNDDVMFHAGNKFCFDVCGSVTLLFVSIYAGRSLLFDVCHPPILKKPSPRIWTNHRNDQDEFQNRGNPRFRGTISCLYNMQTLSVYTVGHTDTKNRG